MDARSLRLRLPIGVAVVCSLAYLIASGVPGGGIPWLPGHLGGASSTAYSHTAAGKARTLADEASRAEDARPPSNALDAAFGIGTALMFEANLGAAAPASEPTEPAGEEARWVPEQDAVHDAAPAAPPATTLTRPVGDAAERARELLPPVRPPVDAPAPAAPPLPNAELPTPRVEAPPAPALPQLPPLPPAPPAPTVPAPPSVPLPTLP